MNETTQQILDDEQSSTPRIRRRELLPIWIKVFTWIFLVFGCVIWLGFLLALLEVPFKLGLYGFETNDPLSLLGIALTLLFAFKGVVAYGLWWEKDWGVKLAIVDAIVGIVACTVAMLVLPFMQEGLNINLRLELLVLIPYLMKMRKLKEAWEGGELVE